MIVTLNKAGVVHLQKIMLLSGANQVDATVFAEELKNPIVKMLVENGTIGYEEKDLTGKPIAEEKYLDKMKPKEAQELVEQTIDVALLQKWQAVEKRKPVLAAIEKQIKELGAPAKLRSESEPTEELDAIDEE